MHHVRPSVLRPVAAALVLSMFGQRSEMQAQTQNGGETARRAATASIRPGDRIELQFRRDRELNSSINVNERGEAVFPKIGVLDVSRVPIGKLQDSLVTRYTEYLRTPELEVTVLRRIVVNGEVRAPNVYMLDVASSGVRDAIAHAGGLLETSNRGKVYIVRDGQRVHVPDWESTEAPIADLRSGDQVLVGRKSWLTLNALPVISTSVIVIGLIQSLRRN